ncbi:phage head morphogenesis protein [Burkholderia cepacia]|uniref:Phage head morphogenesis protein n=2 Tax=Burkholderia TaxID=32008 RepID=A0ABN5CUZ9_BURCE|nr:phage head morphogenesis, SPP1 gp7 family domain protein [Burkholderia cepacia ATCC 25416]ASE96014.1 phage head morphogenesis protein [Burkholderia cepacia]ATF78983.1 phage head morphogenesis protein [Burkholderia cepacia]QCY03226.1 phage head morphogenesis protein [Burkholderia cepacia ATCC 25416]SPU85513.1 putative phage head protein [Burkholderia cepacia]
MLADLNRRDEQAWMQNAQDMSHALRDELRRAPTGETMRALMAEQVGLIKSIPLDAAERVHRLTIEALEDSTRASEISKMIQASGSVAKSRADLIARTEVGRTATTLTEARALHVGSPGYFWRTSDDSDVREDHRILEGRFITWDNPPIADRRTGRRAHAGCIYGCRCYPEVVFPKD